MKIGDRVRENVRDPHMMVPSKDQAPQALDENGRPAPVEVFGTIDREGAENEWHVIWDDGRETDQNEFYAKGKREGEPCLLLVE